MQRQLNTPWEDYAWVDDVVMISGDTKVTTINLSLSTGMQVAQGSIVNDKDGTRTAMLLFPEGTQASDGTTSQIGALNVRLTEYTVGENGPKTMPAPLPPQTAYTYCIELGADEAQAKINGKDVLFNQPAIFYVDNFLDFPVGIPVPTGYYDNTKGMWIPSDSGRVIKIMGVTDGKAAG